MATYVVLKPFIGVLSVKESYVKLEEEGKRIFLKVREKQGHKTFH